jgi:transposase-like protein
VDILEKSITDENAHMTQKPRRIFTDKQKAEAVRIVGQSGKPVSHVAKKMGLTESALRNWVKQAQNDQQHDVRSEAPKAEHRDVAQIVDRPQSNHPNQMCCLSFNVRSRDRRQFSEIG